MKWPHENSCPKSSHWPFTPSLSWKAHWKFTEKLWKRATSWMLPHSVLPASVPCRWGVPEADFGTYRALTPPYVFLFSNRRLLIIQSPRDLQCYSTFCRNIRLYELWYITIIYFSFACFKPTASPFSRLQQHTCSCWFSHWHSKTNREFFTEIIQYVFTSPSLSHSPYILSERGCPEAHRVVDLLSALFCISFPCFCRGNRKLSSRSIIRYLLTPVWQLTP